MDRKNKKNNRVGEQIRAKNGLMMTIIAYRNVRDIDIQFEDGVIVTHKAYYNFTKGLIKHPNVLVQSKFPTTDRIGETNTAKNGLKMTIIAYRNAKDIDIQFEDGTIVKHKAYSHFKNGCIGHSTISTSTTNRKNPPTHFSKKAHIGEVVFNTITNENMTLIDWITYDNITIRLDDGTILEHIRYETFKKGRNKLPLEKAKIGTTIISKNWGKIECIGFRSNSDFDLRFEYENIIREHCKSWSNFLNGKVSPIYKKHSPNSNLPLKINDTSFSKYGKQLMTIIDIDNTTKKYKVQFEDGYITDWIVNIRQFRNGDIYNPIYHKKILEDKYMGKTVKAINGMYMTVIKVNPPDNKHKNTTVDIQFEDGIIRKYIAPGNFMRGFVKHPTLKHYKTINTKNKLNTTIIQNTVGLSMWIKEYNDSHDIIVQFETGYTYKRKSISDFYNGKIKHPFPYIMDNITIEKPAYVFNGIGNFYCHCTKCGYNDIMTIDEVKEHKCIKKEDN